MQQSSGFSKFMHKPSSSSVSSLRNFYLTNKPRRKVRANSKLLEKLFSRPTSSKIKIDNAQIEKNAFKNTKLLPKNRFIKVKSHNKKQSEIISEFSNLDKPIPDSKFNLEFPMKVWRNQEKKIIEETEDDPFLDVRKGKFAYRNSTRMSVFRQLRIQNMNDQSKDQSRDREENVPYIMAFDHEVKPINNLLKQLDQWAIAEERKHRKVEGEKFQRYDYTEKQMNDRHLQVSAPGQSKQRLSKRYHKKYISPEEIPVELANYRKRKLKTLESFMIIQQIKKFCSKYSKFFQEINRYYHDSQKIKVDVTRIVENNFEAKYATIFMNGFLRKGKLLNFTNVSQSKVEQLLNEMLE